MAATVGFIEPMLLLRTDALPDDAERWAYQIKLDGYRAIAFKKSGILHLRSRSDNDFSQRYPAVMDGLARLPAEECVWLKPELVAEIEFLEWTADNHLRHSRFIGLREDKRAKDVRRE